MKEISDRELQLPDSILGHLQEIASENKKIISLGIGEPDFITPKPILAYAKKIIKNSTHYTSASGKSDLKEAIIKKLRIDNKINAKPENILISCGSQEAIFSGLLATIDPSEQVIIPNPGYLGYIPAIDLVNGAPIYLELKEEENFEINPDKLRGLIDKKKTKVIIINSPSNPTGKVLGKKILEEIADIAVNYDLYIFSDEAYEKLIYDKKHISIGSLNGMKDYVVTFQSFSKTYAMCGFRLGYACGPKGLIKAMTKSIHYLTLCAPTISQLLGIKALSIKKKYIEKMVNEYNKRRLFIVKRLNEIGLKTLMPNGAFYTFSNIKHLTNNSTRFSNNLLKKTKVAIVPGVEFGKYGEGYIRCSYATNLKLIETAMNRLEKFIKKH